MLARLQYLRFCLSEMYVNVLFVIRCLYSAMSLTLVKEQCFIRFIYYYYVYVDMCPYYFTHFQGYMHYNRISPMK